MPGSTLKAAVANVLKEQGYITDFELKEGRVGTDLVVKLKYSRDAAGSSAASSASPSRAAASTSTATPSRASSVAWVIAVISTSQGVITGHEARRRGIGGEVICAVW